MTFEDYRAQQLDKLAQSMNKIDPTQRYKQFKTKFQIESLYPGLK